MQYEQLTANSEQQIQGAASWPLLNAKNSLFFFFFFLLIWLCGECHACICDGPSHAHAHVSRCVCVFFLDCVDFQLINAAPEFEFQSEKLQNEATTMTKNKNQKQQQIASS